MTNQKSPSAAASASPIMFADLPAIVRLQPLKFGFEVVVGPIDRPQHLDDLRP